MLAHKYVKNQLNIPISFVLFDKVAVTHSLTEYRSKRSADGANAVDEATTAKRGERNLYRLLRTLKKRGGPGDYRLLRTLKKRSSPGSFGNIFRHWALVHKRRPSTFGRFGR